MSRYTHSNPTCKVGDIITCHRWGYHEVIDVDHNSKRGYNQVTIRRLFDDHGNKAIKTKNVCSFHGVKVITQREITEKYKQLIDVANNYRDSLMVALRKR